MKVAQIDDNLMWEEQSTQALTQAVVPWKKAAGVLWLLAHDELFLSGGENCLGDREYEDESSQRVQGIHILCVLKQFNTR
jgi:hypothetical protein